MRFKHQLKTRCLGALMVSFFTAGAFAAAEQSYKAQVEPLLKNYCFDCHGDGANKGDITLDAFTNFTAHVADQKLWLSVWQNLETQMMPPAKKPGARRYTSRSNLAAM